ncbi:unnamed protein product [Mytilus coruscus]|uniref:Novel STAND NTPase 3 domain-containing protein n=1 Tax=Mytilus coruscus TaxID=42192 RepID=A0A6J8AUZ3_MYTCO|nr:unnamed protein product [Mytilus coruscus]
MEEEPSTSSGIKRSIPQELQDEINVIASKHQRVIAKPADLDDNQKRWLVVGICLHGVISPAMRKYVVPTLTKLCYKLSIKHSLDTPIFLKHLQKHPLTNKTSLNYEAVNNNKVKHGHYNAKNDYMIKSVVDLSKLFLQTHMVHYTGFDETCDPSALLELIINIDQFAPVVKSDAEDVRKYIRNPWAHCDFTEWDAVKYSNSLQLMKKLVKDLKLSLSEEKQIIGEIEKWEMNDSHIVEMEFWKKQKIMFAEMPAVKKISQILESEYSVLIVGKPGIGKNILMHHVTLKILSDTIYSIIQCSGIQDIVHHYKEDECQVFVLDDICGRFAPSMLETEYLIKNEDNLKWILEKGKTKIAATCRLDIFREETFTACLGGNENILIDKGCDVNQADGKGKTPLTAAYNGGNYKIVQLLIYKGCDAT